MRRTTVLATLCGAVFAAFCFVPTLTRAQESPTLRSAEPPVTRESPDAGVQRAYHLLRKYEGRSLDYRAVAEAPDFSVVVEVRNEIQDKVSPATIRSWTETELRRGAARATILTPQEQRAKYLQEPETDVFAHISRYDSSVRHLYVEVGTLILDDGSKVYQIVVNFNRVTLGPAGIVLSPVFTRNVYGYLGSERDFLGEIQEKVERLVRQFAEEWTRANWTQ